MRISFKRLKRLPVETISGERLGTVFDCILEIDGQLIAQYVVRNRLFGTERLVGRDQIVSISRERIVVENRVLHSSDDILQEQSTLPRGVRPEPVTIRETIF